MFWKRRSGLQPCDARSGQRRPSFPPGWGGGAAAGPERAGDWGLGAEGAGRGRGRRLRGGDAGPSPARPGQAGGGGRGAEGGGSGAGAAPRTPSPSAAPRLAGQVGPAGRRPAPGNNECLSGRPRVTGRGGAEAAREAGVAGEGRRAGCVFARVTRPTPPAAASTQVGGDPPSPGGRGGSLSPP